MARLIRRLRPIIVPGAPYHRDNSSASLTRKTYGKSAGGGVVMGGEPPLGVALNPNGWHSYKCGRK